MKDLVRPLTRNLKIMYKSPRQKKQEVTRKLDKQVWKSIGIERAIKKFGFPAVKHALNSWLTYQRTNAKLLREKRELEQKLSEVESRL